MGYFETFGSLIEKVGPNPTIGELGCHEGSSTKALARIARERKGLLVAIDWFEGSKVDDRFVVVPGHKEEFWNNMKEFNFVLFPVESGIAASIIKDETFDFFWIDADHRYHAIKRDIELWLSKVKKGGILAGHDYDRDTFKEEFIERDYEEGAHHGVTKAVNEKFGKPQVVEGTWWVHV